MIAVLVFADVCHHRGPEEGPKGGFRRLKVTLSAGLESVVLPFVVEVNSFDQLDQVVDLCVLIEAIEGVPQALFGWLIVGTLVD